VSKDRGYNKGKKETKAEHDPNSNVKPRSTAHNPRSATSNTRETVPNSTLFLIKEHSF